MLIAHDLTGASDIALVRAIRIARAHNGHLTVLHVIDERLSDATIAAQRERARDHLESELRRWLPRGTPCRIDIGIGDAARAVAARARAHDVDLVVTGQPRRHSIADLFAPPTLGRLLQQAEWPVLIVSSADQSPYRRLLVPFDLTNASAARIRFAAAFLPEARLHLLYGSKRCLRGVLAALFATSGQDQAILSGAAGRQPEMLPRFIDALALKRKPVVTIENADLLAAARRELAQHKTDLVVCGARVRPGRRHTPAEAVLGSRLRDVLVLPAQA